MNVKKMALNKLTPNPKNIRIHSEKQVVELARSYKSFGQIRPIVVDENNVILAGHGLWEAMVSADIKEGDVLKVEGFSEADKKKLMIADNKIYEMGSTDFSVLNDLLLELKQEDTLSVPGFDDSVLDSMFADSLVIDDKLEEYGTLTEGQADEFRAALDKTQQAIEDAKERGEVSQYGKGQIELNSDLIQLEENEQGENKPYILCPHCGEKVWL